MQGIIKPEDVERLIREGKLWFGMELEFSDGPEFDYIGDSKDIFCGMLGNKFLAQSVKSKRLREPYSHARFPLPALKDGDPVVCSNKLQHRKNCYRHFKEFIFNDGEPNLGIMTWEDGKTKWGSKGSGGSVWCEWRLPTPYELGAGGYTKNQINEMMSRWRAETRESPPVEQKCPKCSNTGYEGYWHDAGDHFSGGTSLSEWRTRQCDCDAGKNLSR